jgi:anti-sigma regulatory factor (Ser/Thr protein kinase)
VVAVADDVEVAHFHAATRNLRAARQLVIDTVTRWGLDEIADAAALCTGELAANAVLHGRTSFDVVIRRRGSGVRIDVIDQRPDEVPAAVPLTGIAVDITRDAATGRGLQIVAATATRWGYTTSESDKSVWAEIEPGRLGVHPDPIALIGYVPHRSPDDLHLVLRSMPVRPAVASGVQVDELVREIQLGATGAGDSSLLARLYRLLDVSAPARLSGRHAALRAAGRHEDRFDLVLDTPMATLVAVGDLNDLLEELSRRRGTWAEIAPEVAEYRRWLREETTRQLAGEAPQPCPLP